MEIKELYYSLIRNIPVLSREEEKELYLKVKSGDHQAKSDFISANLRIVYSIALEYSGKGIPDEDLVGWGNLGLFDAIDKYDTKRGCRFATFADKYIRGKITGQFKSKKNHEKRIITSEITPKLFSRSEAVLLFDNIDLAAILTLKKLSSRDKVIISEAYKNNNNTNTAKKIRVSSSRVCQLRKKIAKNLQFIKRELIS